MVGDCERPVGSSSADRKQSEKAARLPAIGKGELTPDEGNMIGALIERRANLFQTVELQDEIAALKAQIAGIVVTPPRPGLHVVERASPSSLGKC